MGTSAAPLSEPSHGDNACNKRSGGRGGESQLAGCSYADINSSPTKVIPPTDQHTELWRSSNSNICLSVLKTKATGRNVETLSRYGSRGGIMSMSGRIWKIA